MIKKKKKEKTTTTVSEVNQHTITKVQLLSTVRKLSGHKFLLHLLDPLLRSIPLLQRLPKLPLQRILILNSIKRCSSLHRSRCIRRSVLIDQRLKRKVFLSIWKRAPPSKQPRSNREKNSKRETYLGNTHSKRRSRFQERQAF